MSDRGDRFDQVIAAIDTANARDPYSLECGGRRIPAALVYGRRMSEVLGQMSPNAGEHLQIAVRGQHIERWTSPRTSYRTGRAGYLNWRKDLKDFHARRVAEIMATAGYGADDQARVGSLIRKERMRVDPDAQMLEDVACVVFLQYYLDDFIAKTDAAKLPAILTKTWKKMSPLGHAHALRLDLPPSVRQHLP
jgi:Domain of unknown function (DUF4202)